MNPTYTHPFHPFPLNFEQVTQLTFPNGIYEGEVKDGMKQGLGLFIWKTGDAYIGSWQEDKMHGKGLYCYNTGHYIEGIFNSNLVDGAACLTYPDRSFTKAIFMNGQLNGRALFYQTEKNGWVVEDYESGKPKEPALEGQGKPFSSNFFTHTHGSDCDYIIKAVKIELAAPFSMGCFEVEGGAKHYGFIKDGAIEGLGIRIHKSFVEVGKFRKSRLDGEGRRLEFGKSLYVGEFIHSKYYGKGTLREFRDKMITTTVGIYIDNAITHKISEEIVSLHNFDIASYLESTSSLRIIDLDFRTFVDSFTKDYYKADLHKEINIDVNVTPKAFVFDAQELHKCSLTRTLSKDSMQNSPSRRALMETASHLAKMVNAVHNDPYDITTTLQATQGYIDQLKQKIEEREARPKRSYSSDRNLEPTFQQVFSIGVEERPGSALRSHRSASKDHVRSASTQIIIDTQIVPDNQKNLSSTGFTSYVNNVNNGAGYHEQGNAMDFTAKRFSSPAINPWSINEPSTGANLSPNRIISEDRGDYGHDVRSESPLLSSITPKKMPNGVAATHKIYTLEEQRKLYRGQKNSKSFSDLRVTVDNTQDKRGEKTVKNHQHSGARDVSPARKNILTITTAKVVNERSTPSGLSSTSNKTPTNQANRPKTPTKSGYIQHNSTIPKTLEKKGSTPTPKTKATPTTKTPSVKDKMTFSTAQKSLQKQNSTVKAGASPLVKKSTAGTSAVKNQERNPPTSRKSSRVMNESPVVEVDLYTYSQGGNSSASAKKDMNTSAWSAQKNSYVNDDSHSHYHQHHQHYEEKTPVSVSSQKSFNTEKSFTKNKTPVVSNVVSIDISMFRADTPSASEEKRSNSPVQLKADLTQQYDHWTVGHTDNRNSYINKELGQNYNQTVHQNHVVTDKNFADFRGYAINSAGKEEKKISTLDLAFANGDRVTIEGLGEFNLQTFDRRFEENSEGDHHGEGKTHADKLKQQVLNHHSMGTPSFSLNGHKNFKFTEEKEKRRSNTPSRLARDEVNPDYRGSPGKRKVESPYKIDVRKQKFSILANSPSKKKSGPGTPSKEEDSKQQDSSSYDSSKGYPVKKTCNLNGESHCCGSHCSSNKGSPVRSPSLKDSPQKQTKQFQANEMTLGSPEKTKISQQQYIVDECKTTNAKFLQDFQGFAAIDNKFGNLQDFFNQGKLSPNPVNSERHEASPHYTGHDAPLPQFGNYGGTRSGSATPRSDRESEAYKQAGPKYSIIEEQSERTEYFNAQPENFAARATNIKRPKLLVDPKLTSGMLQNKVYNKPEVLTRTNSGDNNTRSKSPTQETNKASRPTIQEGTGSWKDAQGAFYANFGGQQGTQSTKVFTNGHNHSFSQVHRLPEEIRTVLNPYGVSEMGGLYGRPKEGGEQSFGGMTSHSHVGPIREAERSKSVSKLHGRDREMNF